jgi:broad specificity phosphatase PhoE
MTDGPVELGPMTVRFVRHGESVANVKRTFSYRINDEPLTDLGQAQAVQVAAYLADVVEQPALVVSSPLRRALETAAPIVEALGAELLVDEGFREVDVGELDGRTGQEAFDAHNEVFDAWTDGVADARMPGGEDLHELGGRVEAALIRSMRAAELAGARELVVVAHGGIMYQGVRWLLPGIVGDATTAWIGNASVTELHMGIEEGRLTGTLIAWASDGHLVEATE